MEAYLLFNVLVRVDVNLIFRWFVVTEGELEGDNGRDGLQALKKICK
jgi:hypothetical protein